MGWRPIFLSRFEGEGPVGSPSGQSSLATGVQKEVTIMQFQQIALTQLCVSNANMRAGKKPPDLGDLLPSVRLRGVLIPLLVRPDGSDDRYEIVAGRRRYHAASLVADEGGADSLPCVVMEGGDDASALEASILENVARAEPHEVEQWTSLTRLVREGRSADEIAILFGLTQRQVAQILGLGNLLKPIRELYRAEEIDAGSVRLLTMATKAQQKDWLAALADPDRFAPMGPSLKSWLFGGAAIPTAHAIFDLENYEGAIVADLFGEGGYFADPDAFWAAQRAAIDERRQTYLEAGWGEVVLLEPGHYFSSWDYVKAGKNKGGKVYIDLSQRGEVAFHEGYLTMKEARRQAAGEEPQEAKAPRAEVTGALNNYLDLHRHAATRAAMLDAPQVALRMVAAHLLSGSYLFSVRPDPQRSANDAITESVENCVAEARFDGERRQLLALLGLDAECPTLIQWGMPIQKIGRAQLFACLLALDDADIMRVTALAMGEALEVGSLEVEMLARHLGLDMGAYWEADTAFIDLLRDREVLGGMIGEVAGADVADANKSGTIKAQRTVLADCLAGSGGRAKAEGWLPRWLRQSPAYYTERGGVASVRHAQEAASLLEGAGERDNEDGLAAPAQPEEDGEGEADALSEAA